VFADKSGTVLDDNDFYPWGGVVPGIGQTTSNNTIKFTGQYRDGESQLDYFGARYYSNAIGRFMSPDWAAKPVTVPYAKFGDPQTLNLYSYVENGPVNRIDAGGHSYVMLDTRNGGGGGGEVGAVDSEISFFNHGFDFGMNGHPGETGALHDNFQNAGNNQPQPPSSAPQHQPPPQTQPQQQQAQQEQEPELVYRDQNVARAQGELREVLACTQRCAGGGIVITSTSEPNRQHGPGTPHRQGEAADLRVAPQNEQTVMQCAANCGAQFGQNERIHPSSNSTGPHIHIQTVPGRHGGRGDLPRPTQNLRQPQPAAQP
jgi:RHS repeat-associated protein